MYTHLYPFGHIHTLIHMWSYVRFKTYTFGNIHVFGHLLLVTSYAHYHLVT